MKIKLNNSKLDLLLKCSQRLLQIEPTCEKEIAHALVNRLLEEFDIKPNPQKLKPIKIK
jgi:hypothetical protein